MPRTSPTFLCLSNSSLVFSSMARMSSIVSPCHLSIQQKTCLKTRLVTLKEILMIRKIFLPMERSEESTLRLLNEIFYFRLKTKPFKFTCNELIACHYGINFFLPILTDERTSSCFQ